MSTETQKESKVEAGETIESKPKKSYLHKARQCQQQIISQRLWHTLKTDVNI